MIVLPRKFNIAITVTLGLVAKLRIVWSRCAVTSTVPLGSFVPAGGMLQLMVETGRESPQPTREITLEPGGVGLFAAAAYTRERLQVSR